MNSKRGRQSNLFLNCSRLYLILCIFILVGHTGKTRAQDNDISWSDFTLNMIGIERLGNTVQPIVFSNSQPGTTEFLILSASHGNPPDDTREKEASVSGGDWIKIV